MLRYSDEDLNEFWDLIEKKLKVARGDYSHYKGIMSNNEGNGTDDTGATFKVLEEGADTLSKEEAGRLAQRQALLINHLEKAQIRIKNKTYGICRKCSKLIPKERLRAALHATLCAEEKPN
ncbi:MAG: TraR/DksA C4-type zinc finger protein [Candidatus Paceibacterota bacterium]